MPVCAEHVSSSSKQPIWIKRRPWFSFSFLGDTDWLQRGAGGGAALLPNQQDAAPQPLPLPGCPLVGALFVIEALDPVVEVVDLHLLHLPLRGMLAAPVDLLLGALEMGVVVVGLERNQLGGGTRGPVGGFLGRCCGRG